jgi:hypothetical protein
VECEVRESFCAGKGRGGGSEGSAGGAAFVGNGFGSLVFLGKFKFFEFSTGIFGGFLCFAATNAVLK